MIDIAWMATIGYSGHDAVGDANPGFGLPQQQNSSVAGGRATVEIGFDLAT